MDPPAFDAPCGFLIFDDSGCIVSANPALHRMLGYGKGAFPAAKMSEILSIAGQVFYQTHFFPTLKLEGQVEEVYLTLQGKEGQAVPFLVNATRIEHGGRTVNYAALFKISKRGRFEEELLKAKKEAERANQAKDDFLAALSHELRTPLTPVLLTAAMLESDPALPEEIRKQMSSIRRNAELEARLIDDLLDVTRISHGKLRLDQTHEDVHGLVSHALELVRHDCHTKNIGVTTSWNAAFHFVSGDAARLQQVFWNLLQNAVKFTPPGGHIRVSTENGMPGEVLLSFTDSGKGIPPDQLSRIFEAFEQGDIQEQRQYGGLGLGLAISFGIVKLHRGTIRAESEGTGRGATFTVKLPTVSNPVELPPAAPGDPVSVPPLKILLVEDHDSSREILALLLRRAGHQVTAFPDGRTALDFAATAPVDLLISDLGLPGMSGGDLMSRLKSTGVKGIALSGYGSDDDFTGTAEAGFSAHLVKPVRITELKALISRVWVS